MIIRRPPPRTDAEVRTNLGNWRSRLCCCGGGPLAAQAETVDQFAVAVDVGLGHVVEQAATTTDQQKQAAT